MVATVESGGPVALPPPEPVVPPPPVLGPPLPPVEDRAAQDAAIARIERDLDDSGIFNTVSRDEARDAVAALTGLSGIDAGRVIDRLEESGKLDQFVRESVEGQGSWLGDGGMSRDEQGQFFDATAQRLDGAHLATLTRAYEGVGSSHGQALADSVARFSSPETALGFVRATAPHTTDGGRPNVMGGSFVDGDARNVATVVANLRGDYAAQAFAALDPAQRAAVFTASTGLETATISGGYSAVTVADVRPEGFARLMDAARSITDPTQRAAVLNDATTQIGTIRQVHGVEDRHVAPLARAVVGALDAPSLAAMGPQQASALAGYVAKSEPADLAASLGSVSRLTASPARDALIRTVFLKTDAGAYDGEPGLATAMGQAFARTQTSDTTRIGELGASYARTLGTDEGRALLADPNVNPGARLWAMGQVAADPARIAGLIAGHDKPWEAPGLVELYAVPRTEQFATARGDGAVALNGGTDFANFVGAGLGAPMRTDLPTDEASLQTAQANAATGGYDFYAGVDAVQKPADGIRAAQAQMGGGDVSVGVLPIQFSAQASGPVELQLYRVEGTGGQSRYVDNIGRVYSDFNAWRTQNELPPGQMTYPVGGHLGSPGATQLETSNTPNVSDSFWEHARDVADVAALVGGVVASGVIIIGSGGTATPLIAGAWTVALGSAAYTGARAAGDLIDRAQHEQSLALTDPEARAAWISLGASGLTVAGAGVTRVAGLAANESRIAINGARAAGILNTSANFADAAATADTANALVQNWDRLTPGERAQMGLQIAFWGGMTGVSARAGGGPLTDAFNFRAQINHAMLQTGGAIRSNPELSAGEASVVPTRNAAGVVTDLRVEYGPGTSRAVIDVHTDVARQLIANSGAEGVMRRTFGDPNAFRPGTRGEEVSLEVAKHEALLAGFTARLADPTLSATDRTSLTTAQGDARFELYAHRTELADIRANPALGSVAGQGSIDVKQSARHWLDPENTVPRDASAQTSFAALRTDVAQDYPNAQRATLNANGSLTLADGSEIRNFGARTNPLTRFGDPQAQGGYGGALFYDRASNTVIAAVNMRTAGDAGTVTRVEVPYRPNAAGEWRADFTQSAPYKTAIDPNLIRDRAEHFRAANQNLRDAMVADPALAARLSLTPEGAAAVRAASGTSPAPFTWHHVDGGGQIWLVDSALHGVFLHTGGFSEWATGGTARAR